MKTCESKTCESGDGAGVIGSGVVTTEIPRTGSGRRHAELAYPGDACGLGLTDDILGRATIGGTPRSFGTGAESLVGSLHAAMQIAAAHRQGPDVSGPTPDHEHVTVLFTDLAGWTLVSSRLSPDQADDLRHRHFSTLHRSIAAWGGTEVKNLGDGSMVVFSMASAALACAVAMQRAVVSDNDVGGHALGLRVGLSGGEVTREDGDCFGDPVVEAARLCACASSGQILAAQVVKAMAGRRGQFRYRALGPLDLKGFPEPLETFEVGWEPDRGAGWDEVMAWATRSFVPPGAAPHRSSRSP